MSKNKYTYPKGIYANRFKHTPDFVFSEIKMDREKAIAELQACDQPFLYLQVLRSREPDEKGNHAFMVVHDYMMERQREKAASGIANAKAALEKPSQPKAHEFPEDDIPF